VDTDDCTKSGFKIKNKAVTETILGGTNRLASRYRLTTTPSQARNDTNCPAIKTSVIIAIKQATKKRIAYGKVTGRK
jgi:hypothetical protein